MGAVYNPSSSVNATLSGLINATSDYIIGGKGTIAGSSNADKIIANDANTSVKASNDDIKSGKGDDVIRDQEVLIPRIEIILFELAHLILAVTETLIQVSQQKHCLFFTF